MDSSNKLIPAGAKVEDFKLPVIGEEQRPSYRSIKESFKPDSAKPENRSFILSEMIHSHMGVEAEEERRFHAKVELEVNKYKKEVYQDAHQEGFEKGIKEGHQKGYEEEKGRLAALIEGLASNIKAIEGAKQALAQNYEQRLVDLAYRMAELIVHSEIEKHPELVAASIRAVLEKIGKEEDVRIRLAADDHTVLEQIKSELKSASHEGRITFDVDENLERGNCLVESSAGEIASFLDEKLKTLKAELMRIYPDLGKQETGS